MKVTDFIANYIASLHIEHVFVLQGGAALHLIDSVEKHPLLTAIPMQHEQACAMAADAYAKSQHKLGVTMVTSGPGATNLLTGIASSFFDSVPSLHITGNVASFRQSDNLGVRQYGFQETDIVSMAKPITKFSVRLEKAEDIITILPKAIRIALEGRMGPVLIDIPDNFQRVELDTIINFNTSDEKILPYDFKPEKLKLTDEFLQLLARSIKPVFVFGSGILHSGGAQRAVDAATHFGIPFLTTWPVKGICNYDEPLNLGNFGTHSFRGNNFVIQNADLIISLGCRLDSRATAKLDTFATKASIAIVDIDLAEINKFESFGRRIDFKFNVNCLQFLDSLKAIGSSFIKSSQIKPWLTYIEFIRNKYNFLPNYNFDYVNPYVAAKYLTKHASQNAIYSIDTGTCLPLTLVYGEEKQGDKFLSSYNNTPMGYALPAAIGAALSSKKHVYCISGDGGLQMNIQELSTLYKLQLPVTIIVFNNSGHCMIKQTQDDWLDSNYAAADNDHGLPDINFSEVSTAYGIKSFRVYTNNDFEKTLEQLNKSEPALIELIISSDFRYEPIIKYGNPLEMMSPAIEHGKDDYPD